MAITRLVFPEKEIVWTRELIKQLRGKRTQTEFGKLLGVPKNTVWRWEAGRVAPDAAHYRSLSRLAGDERFLTRWKLVGSGRILADLEKGSREVTSEMIKNINRSGRRL